MNQQAHAPKQKGLLARVFEDAQLAKKVWETISWGISAGGTVAGFVNEVGGPWQFFIEVFAFGFACYIAVIPAGVVLAAVVWLLEQVRLEPTDKATVGLLVVLVLGIGLIVRFALFYPGITRSMDAFGSAFAGLVGIAILLTPAYFYLRRHRHHFVQPIK